MAKFIKYSHFIGSHDDGTVYTNSGTFFPTDSDVCSPYYYNADSFNGQTLGYEFDCSLHSGVTGAEVRILDLTTGTAVTGSTQAVSSSGRFRVSGLSLESLHEYIIQGRVTAGTGYIRVVRPRIIIVQSTTSITKTETLFPLTSNHVPFDSATYTSIWPSGNNGTNYSGGIFTYDASKFDGTVTAYIEAHFGATSGNTSYIRLYDITSSSVVPDSEITVTTDALRVRSDAFTLEDGKQYIVQTKSSNATEALECGEVRLVVKQVGNTASNGIITKTETFFDLRLSNDDVLVSGTSYAAINTLDTGSTTDHGAYFAASDYETYAIDPEFIVLGRKAGSGAGTYSMKVYDLEGAADLASSEIVATDFPYQSKIEESTDTGFLVSSGTAKYTIYAKKTVSDENAYVSVFGLLLHVHYSVVTNSFSARARIDNESMVRGEVFDTVRRIENMLEVNWSGNEWVDETCYLISVNGNSRLGDYDDSIVSDECDFELDNTSKRFLPENTESDIYQYIKPRVKIRYSVGVNGYFTKMFTGYIKAFEPNRRSGTVNFHCFDNTVKLFNKESPDDLYTNKRYDEVVEILCDAAGIEAGDRHLQVSQKTADAVWFENKLVRPVLSDIAFAERGRIYFNESGNLIFLNSDYFNNLQPKELITRQNSIINFNFNVEEQGIKNKVRIEAKPRRAAGIQVVWSNGDAVASDQYNTPLVWIPAYSTQSAWIELDDPAIDWQTPLADTDYVANTLSDGSGTNMTSSVSIDSFVTYQQSAFIEVTNNSATAVYLTEFNVRANPLKVNKWIRVTEQDDNSIENFGVQDISIENNWIQDPIRAAETAETIVTEASSAKTAFVVSIFGIPYIRVGDLLTVESADSTYNVYQTSEITWTVDSSGFFQDIGLKEFSWTSEDTSTAGIGSGVIGQGVVGVANNLRGKTYSFQAKARILKTQSKSFTAKARIA